MQIDWLTVAAQIVNFLVLVWLLRRFLYRPISDAMRRREQRIEARLAEARSAREEAEAEARRLKERQEELAAREEEILDAARQEAEALRGRLEAAIREDMEEKREAWHAHLAAERDAFAAQVSRQAGTRLIEIARRILRDYADSDLADRVVATFADRMRGLDDDMRDKLAQAAERADAPALVETGSVIDAAARRRVTRTIHDVLSTGVEVEYREDPELLLGLRLTIGDHHVEWSATRYLDRLKTEMGEIIDAGRHGGPHDRADETQGTA